MNSKKSIYPKIAFPLAVLALLCGCKKQEQRPSPGPGGAIVSAEKTSFDEVTSKLDRGGNFYLYLSTEQTLSGLSSKMSSLSNFVSAFPGVEGEQAQNIGKAFDFANSWIKDSGIEQISGLGMSSIAREPGFYYSKLIVHHYPDKNDGLIWSVFGKSPHPLQELNLLPETTAMATFSDLNVPLAWKDIEKHLKALDIPAVTYGLEQMPDQFAKQTGLDFDKVLASFGGNFGIIVTLDQQNKVTLPVPSGPMEIPSPGLAIIAKVKSDLIFDRIDKLNKNNPLVARVDDSDLKMRTMAVPIPLPVELRPSIARSGDYLILATTDTLVKDMLAVKSGKKKGLKSTAEFARLSQGMPEEGNSFSFVSDQFMKSMLQIQQQTLTNKGTMTSAQVESMQHAFNSATNFGSYAVGVNGSEGWEGYANGSQSAQSVILGGVAGIGVAAGFAIPSIIKARAGVQSQSSSFQQGNSFRQGGSSQPSGVFPQGISKQQGNSSVQQGISATQAKPAADPETVKYNRIIRNLRLLQTAKQKWIKEQGKTDGDAATMADIAPYLANGLIKPVDDEVYDPQPAGAQPTAQLAHDLHGHAAGSDISAPAIKKAKPAAQ